MQQMRREDYFVPPEEDPMEPNLPLVPLSQEELEAWWPFKRLDPQRFPKSVATSYSCLEDFEDAPF